MRRLFIYIVALLALSVSCQMLDLPEEVIPTEKPTCTIGSKATITFSTAGLMNAETKAIIDPSKDVETLHLILFDENGMYVEMCEASKLGSSDHDDHEGGRHYTVTLTLTDQPRIIHFVANCPVEQVKYGHEISIIGNMYVDKNDQLEHTTQYETSYWARIEVPHILVKETEETLEDGTKKTVVSLTDDIVYKFNHVPLLRNFAEILVEDKTDKTDNTFKFEGYAVYNIIDRGTVAPYNSNTQSFQSFLYHPDPQNSAISSYSYPQLTGLGYEGHALSTSKLITDLARNDDNTVKVFASGEPFYVFERKVSVMTDEEDKWIESPPHIIIKGKYNNGQPVTDDSPTYYYKMDLVYTEKDALGHEDIKYYNILRNFMYKFYITAVHDEGYLTLDEAKAGASGNNLSGSTSASKLTNVSDNEGRLWVSYTDTTLVTKNAVKLKYKYIPNYFNAEDAATYQKIDNSRVRFENVQGNVISNIEVENADIIGNGPWAGYREVIVHINDADLDHIIYQQTLSLKTDNAHLNREVRYTLRDKLTMEVECTPKVAGSMMQPVTVDVKLPLGMTDDMFPLTLGIETFDRTLSPDAKNNENPIPVTPGPSIIDVDGRRGELSYYYTVTIPTLAAYQGLPSAGDWKVYSTYWLTNKADNASTVYVDNKYFNQGSDNWENYRYTFSNLSCTASEVGINKSVSISFNMDTDDANYRRAVTVSLEGMTYNGATTFEYMPNTRNVTINGLKTTTEQDKVSFTLDANEYAIASVEGARQTYKFNGAYVGNVTRFGLEAGIEADFQFDIPADSYYDGMIVYVTLDRLVPADDEENLEYDLTQRAVGERYLYRVPGSGRQTIRLATAEALEGDCTVTLEAQYFYTEVVTVPQVDRVFEFGDVTATPKQITSSSTVTISFKIPADAWAAGQNTMPVNVTLDRLEPADDKLTGSNGNYVYNVTKSYNNSYSFTVRPTENTAGDCKVTLNAAGFIEEPIDINQTRDLRQVLSWNWNNGTNNFSVSGANGSGVNNGAFYVTNNSRRTNDYDVQVYYDVPQADRFVVGRTYRLVMKIRGTSNNSNNTIYPILQRNADPWQWVVDFKELKVPTSNNTYTEIILEGVCTGEADNNARRLQFNIGHYQGTLYFDELTLYYYE